MKSLFLFSVLFGFAMTPMQLFAEEQVIPELHISTQGEAHVIGGDLTHKHALNLLSVKIWGLNISVSTDYTTVYESAYGAPINSEDILPGHSLEVVGRPSPEGGSIEAKLLRDLSIKTGTPKTKTLALERICKEPEPKKTPKQASAKGAPTRTPIANHTAAPNTPPALLKEILVLRNDLKRGAQGREVLWLQEFLQRHGWGIPNDGPVTGLFGKVTEGALKRFQQANGLAAIGILDAKTRMLINPWLKK